MKQRQHFSVLSAAVKRNEAQVFHRTKQHIFIKTSENHVELWSGKVLVGIWQADRGKSIIRCCDNDKRLENAKNVHSFTMAGRVAEVTRTFAIEGRNFGLSSAVNSSVTMRIMQSNSIKILKPNFHNLFIEVIKLGKIYSSAKGFWPFFPSTLSRSTLSRLENVRMTNYFYEKISLFYCVSGVSWVFCERCMLRERNSIQIIPMTSAMRLSGESTTFAI